MTLPPILPRRLAAVAPALLFVGLFAPFLIPPDPPVVSSAKTDIAQYFLHARTFAAEQLRAGNLPLWNPHLLAGTPFLGGFQSAVFYPPNLLHLLLPNGLAINVSVVLHLAFAAFLMRRWALLHGVGEAGALLAAAVLGLGGPLFARVHAGHLTILEGAPWAVLLLLSADWTLEGRLARGTLCGSLALAMLVVVGHPQTALFAGVATAVYLAARLPAARRRGAVLACIPIVIAGAAALSAVQWWIAVAEAPEAIRAALSRESAAGLSLPLDALATVVAPGYFGPLGGPFWGGSYPWEVSLFVGAAAAFLAVYGAVRLPGRNPILATIAVLFLLALGANGPLFDLLYRYVPGFEHFRAWSRFSLPLAMFVALLAGAGFERILREGRPRRRWAIGLALAAAFLGAVALGLRDDSLAALWSGASDALRGAATANDARLAPVDPPRIAGAALGHAAAATLALAALVAFAPVRRGLLASGIAAVALLDLLAYALPARGGFSAADARFDEVVAHLGTDRGEPRVWNAVLPNSAMTNGLLDVRGYDPALLRRTVEFLDRVTLGEAAEDEATSRLLALLRLDTVVALREGRVMSRRVAEPPLPHVALLGEYEYAASREELLERLTEADLSFRTATLLERVPTPRPSPFGAAGRARVVSESTDHLEIEADVPAPALLLVTDAYHPFWHVEGIGGGQASYEILPADGMLRAIPLEAGTHHLWLEYRIPGFRAAALVSAVAWATWCFAALWLAGTARSGRATELATLR